MGESRARAGGQHSNSIQVGPRRIPCSQGKHTIIRSLGVPGGRCVGGVGWGVVGEDGVEVVEIADLGEHGVCWANRRASLIFVFEENVFDIIVACVLSIAIFQHL